MIGSIRITYRPSKDDKDTTLYQDGYYDGFADGFCNGIVATSFGFVFLFVIIGCVLSSI